MMFPSKLGTGKSVFVLLGVAVLVLTSSAVWGQQLRFTIEPLASGVPSGGGTAVRFPVRLRPQFLESNPARFRVDLPDGKSIEVVRESWSEDGATYSWQGRTVGAPSQYSLVSLSLADGRMAGIIETAEARYRLTPTATGHAVVRSRESNYRCSGAVLPSRDLVDLSAAARSGDLVAATEAAGQPVVKILVLYTPDAAGVVGGAIQASAGSAVSYLNRVINNTQVQGSARLVGAEVIDTLDGENGLDNFLPRLRRDAEVARRRAALGADIVHLFVGFSEAGGDCGLGYLLGRGDTARSMAPFAFGASSIRCDAEATFAHEVGHNLGLNHNPEDASTSNPFHPWSFAHRDNDTKTTMSYGRQREIAYYSNPNVTASGFVTGIEGSRDNGRTLGVTMSIASGYVGGSQTPPITPPSGLGAVLESGSTALLTWNDETNDETGFRVEQRIEGGSWSFVAGLPADAVATEVDNLEPGTTYSFRVRTVRDGKTSNPTNVASVTTPSSAGAPVTLTAEPLSATAVVLSWPAAEQPAPNTSRLVIEARSVEHEYQTVGELLDYSDGVEGSMVIDDLVAETPYTFRTSVVVDQAASLVLYGGEASATTLGYRGPCRNDQRSLCLLDGRFEVRVAWRNQNLAGDTGVGTAVPIAGSEETGLFWFFGPQNIELVVKMLDARGFTQSFWQFYGALSDVEYWISTRDVTDGRSRTYHNQPGSQCGLGDIFAFRESSPGGESLTSTSLSQRWTLPSDRQRSGELETISVSPQTSGCIADAETLCFADGRFAVAVDYSVAQPQPETGIGHTLPALSTQDTGFFWFFQESNVELAIKILDARSINQRYWLFFGALSDVEYHLRVTDTATGGELVIDNPAGSFCGGSNLADLGAP